MGVFNKKRTEKELEFIEEQDYEAMLIRHRKKMMILAGIGILFVVVVILIVLQMMKQRVYTQYEITNTINVGDVEQCQFFQYSEGVLRYSNDGISYIVGEDIIWNQAFEMKQPIVDVCDEYMAIADSGGTDIYIYNVEGQQGLVKAENGILDLEVAGQGMIALITKSEETNLIEMYDKEGAQIAMGQTVLSGDGCPVDISLSNDGTKLVASYVYIDNSVARTKVIFYNYSDVGKNEVGRIVGGFEHYEDSMVTKVEFVTNNAVVAFGDDVVSFFAMDERPELLNECILDKEVASVVYNEEYAGLIMKSNSSVDQYIVKMFDIKGKTVLDKVVDFQYTDLKLQDSRLVLNNDMELFVLDIKNDVIKYKGLIREGITKVVTKKSESEYFVITSEEAEEIKLK